MSMTATQQVKEKRGARAHAYEARAARITEFHAAARKNCPRQAHFQAQIAFEPDFVISQGRQQLQLVTQILVVD